METLYCLPSAPFLTLVQRIDSGSAFPGEVPRPLLIPHNCPESTLFTNSPFLEAAFECHLSLLYLHTEWSVPLFIPFLQPFMFKC